MAVGITRNYSLDDVSCIVGTFPLTEYAAGDGVSITWLEDDFVVVQGSHGSVMRAKKHNNVAEATIRIMQGSPANDFLSLRLNIDRDTRLGTFEFLLRDNFGLTLVKAAQAWIKKPPDIKMSEEPQEVEWTIVLGNPQFNVGENLAA
jgi:hypothetical protein